MILQIQRYKREVKETGEDRKKMLEKTKKKKKRLSARGREGQRKYWTTWRKTWSKKRSEKRRIEMKRGQKKDCQIRSKKTKRSEILRR